MNPQPMKNSFFYAFVWLMVFILFMACMFLRRAKGEELPRINRIQQDSTPLPIINKVNKQPKALTINSQHAMVRSVKNEIPYSSSHHCPKCGNGPWYVQYRDIANGHTHKCGNCGTEFWHRDGQQNRYVQQQKPQSQPLQFFLPSTRFVDPYCPNGNCPRR